MGALSSEYRGARAVIRDRRPSLASVVVWDRYDLLSRSWPHNTLNSHELYKFRLWPLYAMNAERQFLAQVTNPEVFVNPRKSKRWNTGGLNYRCER